ncbi:response regulator [Roseimicrobium sp. ORNL1]|uniref:response regulator n=1 Tax=Roseimicrobium sp. ORNL1 TaxID=2711231 RepID=UPI00198010D9|nr:response regulator [Roseimicrobium sp. ORNL1]
MAEADRLFPTADQHHRARLLVVACGGMVALLGLIVMTGWFFQQQVIIQIRGNFAVMQFLTAVCFVLVGVALLARGLERQRVSAVLGLLTGIIGWLLCLEYFLGHDFGFELLANRLPHTADHVSNLRPSPPSALCFALCGTALAVLASPRLRLLHCPVGWVAGACTLSLSLVALVGYAIGLTGTYAWGQFTGMALHSAVGVVILSVGLLAATLRDFRGKTPQDHPWFPVPFAVAGTVATILLWQALLADQRNSQVAEADMMARNLVSSVREQLGSRLRAIDRMAQRWEVREGTPQNEWEQDAMAYLRDEKVFDSIERVDADGQSRWITPDRQHSITVGVPEGTRQAIQEMTTLARESSSRALSPVVPISDGRPCMLVCRPLFPGGKFDGYILVAIDVKRLLTEMLVQSHAEGYLVSVAEDGNPIFSSVPGMPEVENPEARATFETLTRRWDVSLEPRNDIVSKQSRLPNLILVTGLGFTALLALSAVALRMMRSHARATYQANTSLRTEMQERLEVQKRLRESEAKLQAVLDSATGVAVIGVDATGTITFFNRGAEELLGYQAEEMVGQHTPAIFHSADEVKARGEELTRTLAREVQGFEVFVALPRRDGVERREWTYVCKDGTHKTVELTVTLIRDAVGHAIGSLGTAVDITERKRMEERLRKTVRAEQTARALLDAAGRIAKLGHWEFLLDGGGLKWSDTAYAIYEFEPGTPIKAEEALTLFAPAERPIVERAIQQAMVEGEVFDFEARITTGRGRQRWIHIRGEPVRDPLGNIVSLRGVVQDVDERHQAAELLTRRNWELEVATAQAQAHARTKAEFLANMSHEIRTPLNAIIGMSELLHDLSMDERQREYVNTIRVSGDALLGIINDILDFSKIEAGQLQMEVIPFDLRECVESSFDLVSGQASRKKLDLLYWIEPTVPAFLLGDPTRLRQILVNFISNAVKFTERGEVFVRICRKSAPDVPDKLHLSVRDTGIGISPEHQHRLFQSFSQVDSSTSRKYGGTGLGLAICHRLISMMEGRVWVESEPGKGADFQFEIPLQPTDFAPAQVYQRGHDRELQGMRVLVVDDNETNRWILEAQSKAWGMVPRSTAAPAEALSWIERGDPFDIAILDGHMPGMNGFELAEKINAHVPLQQMPVLVLTSLGDSSASDSRPGVSTVISKPLKTQALYESLLRLLGSDKNTPRRKAAPASNPQWALDYPLKILVAEDNPVNQRVISLVLERLGYRPEIVANGLEVLTALQRKKYDLILMDVQMPEMDGLQASREICRLYDRASRPRIIALTANAVAGDKDDCLAAGMDSYLSKPVRSQEIAEALRKTFEERPKVATQPEASTP